VSQRRWSIGELARASGVTVRTLHHYDRIGLVSPAERTAAGHRRYTEADVRRLYRVRALCGHGLSLDEIATVLAGSPDDLTTLHDLLTAQLDDLLAQAAGIAERTGRVRALLGHLDRSRTPDAEQFLELLEPLVLPDEAALTERQRAALTRRADELGHDRVEELKADLFAVLAGASEHVTAGTPVGDPAVVALARRWQQISGLFRTGDRRTDEQVDAAAGALWQRAGAEIGEQLGRRLGWSQPAAFAAAVDYLRSASDQLTGDT
jgi:DNA-binding transcriptional MerR regulator